MDFITAIAPTNFQGPPPPAAAGAGGDGLYKASLSFEKHLSDNLSNPPTFKDAGAADLPLTGPRASRPIARERDSGADNSSLRMDGAKKSAEGQAAARENSAAQASAQKEASPQKDKAGADNDGESPAAAQMKPARAAGKEAGPGPKEKSGKDEPDDTSSAKTAGAADGTEAAAKLAAVPMAAGQLLPATADPQLPVAASGGTASGGLAAGLTGGVLGKAGLALSLPGLAAEILGQKTGAGAASPQGEGAASLSGEAAAQGAAGKSSPEATAKISPAAASLAALQAEAKAGAQAGVDAPKAGEGPLAALPGADQLAQAAQALLARLAKQQNSGLKETSGQATPVQASSIQAAQAVNPFAAPADNPGLTKAQAASPALTAALAHGQMAAGAAAGALNLAAGGAASGNATNTPAGAIAGLGDQGGDSAGKGASASSPAFQSLLSPAGSNPAAGTADASALNSGLGAMGGSPNTHLALTGADGSFNPLPFATLSASGGISLLPGQSAAGLERAFAMGGMAYAAGQVGLQISKTVSAGVNQFSIRLDPAELGRVDVSLQFQSDGRVTATVTADHHHTLDLLRRDAGVLDKALTDSGLKTDPGSLSFSLRQQDQQGGGQQAFQGGGQAAVRRAAPEISSEVSMAGVTAARSFVSNQALDITV